MNWKTYNTENFKGRFLFKFLSEENLQRFLRSGNIWFSRADKFGDKMECVRIHDLIDKRPNFEEIEKRKRKYLIACFHEGNKETLAFWDTYAPSDDKRRKYAIRFNRQQFIQSVLDKTNKSNLPTDRRELIHGKIVYKNLIGVSKDKLKAQTVPHVAFRKEYVFDYEREYRFVIHLRNESSKEGFNFNIGKATEIPFKILVNPLLENKDYIKCLDKIKELGYENNHTLSVLAKWLKPELW